MNNPDIKFIFEEQAEDNYYSAYVYFDGINALTIILSIAKHRSSPENRVSIIRAYQVAKYQEIRFAIKKIDELVASFERDNDDKLV